MPDTATLLKFLLSLVMDIVCLTLPYGAIVVVICVTSIMNMSAGHLVAAWLGLVAMPLWMIAYEMRSTRLAAEGR